MELPPPPKQEMPKPGRLIATDDEREQLAKERKFAKKKRRREAKGTDIPQDEFDQQREDIKQSSYDNVLERASGLNMPLNVQLDTVKTTHPDLYEQFMALGERPHASKEQDLLTNRIIWFNEFDKQHTFRRKHPCCRANMMLIGHHKAQGTTSRVPLLLLRYCEACQEHMEQNQLPGPKFKAQEQFLEAWQNANAAEDVERFSNSTGRFFDTFAARLRRLVLSSPPGVGPMEQSSVFEIGELDGSEDVLHVDVDIKFKMHPKWVRETVREMVNVVTDFLKAEECERSSGMMRGYATALGVVEGGEAGVVC